MWRALCSECALFCSVLFLFCSVSPPPQAIQPRFPTKGRGSSKGVVVSMPHNYLMWPSTALAIQRHPQPPHMVSVEAPSKLSCCSADAASLSHSDNLPFASETSSSQLIGSRFTGVFASHSSLPVFLSVCRSVCLSDVMCCASVAFCVVL